MASGDPMDPATLAWFINSIPARTLAIEPGEIEFANDTVKADPPWAYALRHEASALLAERDSLQAERDAYRIEAANLMAEVAYWKAEHTRAVAANNALIAEAREVGAAIAALDPHDFGNAVETVEIEIPDARDGITLTSASHPTGCIAPGETVTWSTHQFAATDWAGVFGKLRLPMVETNEIRAANVASVDTVFVVDDPGVEYSGTVSKDPAPVDPRAIALARAFKL